MPSYLIEENAVAKFLTDEEPFSLSFLQTKNEKKEVSVRVIVLTPLWILGKN
jgi:hypothetical protein